MAAVGATSPGVPQKLPGVQEAHSLAAASDVLLEKVPAGHGNCAALDVLAGQKKPSGHGAGVIVPASQYDRAVHVKQNANPVTFAKVPGTHGLGTLVPARQAWPTGQVTFGVATPPMHTNPASHSCVTFMVAGLGHLYPAGHGKQSASASLPLVVEYVPAGHAIGLVDAGGQ
jgi:hypothetical protein